MQGGREDAVAAVAPNRGILGRRGSPKRIVASLMLLGVAYLAVILLADSGKVDRAAASVVLILGLYLSLRPPRIVHPCTPVLLNYVLYVVMPYSLFAVYRAWQVEYVLPWGLINNWATLSHRAIGHFELTFTICYVCIYVVSTYSFASRRGVPFQPAVAPNYSVRERAAVMVSILVIVGGVVQFTYMGDLSSWLTNYELTYSTGKAGIGALNISLINLAHVVAFLAGWMLWKSDERYQKSTWTLIVLALLLCIILQGIKSRVPLLLFFFLAPRIARLDVKIWVSVLGFMGMITFFMVAMYFRSQGFYATPAMAFEYLQSYFNTIFLHDIALTHYPQGEMNSMLMGARKFSELFVGKIPRETYDLSVALTQQFFPNDWYRGGATQQWPVETDFYLTFPSPLFWLLPMTVYATLLGLLYRWSQKGSPLPMFIFAAEFVRVFTVFRSSLLTVEAYLQAVLYLFVFALFSSVVFKRVMRPVVVSELGKSGV